LVGIPVGDDDGNDDGAFVPDLEGEKDIDGAFEGDVVGSDEGSALGDTLGLLEGLPVGETEGKPDDDGSTVGITVGDKLGFFVGETLGDDDGTLVGDKLGSFVGESLGDADGTLVGDKLGSFVGESLGDADGIFDKVGSIVGVKEVDGLLENSMSVKDAASAIDGLIGTSAGFWATFAPGTPVAFTILGTFVPLGPFSAFGVVGTLLLITLTPLLFFARREVEAKLVSSSSRSFVRR